MEEDGSTLLQRSCLDLCHADSCAGDIDRVAIRVIVLLMLRHNFNLYLHSKNRRKRRSFTSDIPAQGVPLLPCYISSDNICPQTSLESPFCYKKLKKL
jgi:hypothetical protein